MASTAEDSNLTTAGVSASTALSELTTAAAETTEIRSSFVVMNETELCGGVDPLLVRNGSHTYSVLSLVVPSNATYWEERTPAYWVFFYAMLVVFGLLFLCLAVGCIVLLAKRHLAKRFKVRTFIAIDLALMVLGISRVLFFILDPWGQSGFCGHIACIIISRLIGALAFPSLTASYTLVLITLWISARMQLGMSCIQRLKILVPLCFVHYVVAIAFEILGSLPIKNSMVVVILLVVCEATFSIWGFTVCFSFLFTGHRLLKHVEKAARSSSMICRDSPNLTRHQLIEKSNLQNQALTGRNRSRTTLKLKHMLREHHQRAIRKVTLITYLTVTLGMLYSIVTFVNLILACLSLFFGCPGYLVNDSTRQVPGVWLMLRYVTFTLELSLAILLTYSISDYQPILNLLCCGLRKVGSRQGSPTGMDSTCTSVDSEFPSKVSPNIERSPPPCIVKENSKISDLSLNGSTSSSTSPVTSPTGLNSSPSPSTPKRVKIFEYDTSAIANKDLTRSVSQNYQPKAKSPLTVSYSAGDHPA